jgi:hypothetical protein
MVDEAAIRDIFSGRGTYFQAIWRILKIVRHADGRNTPSTSPLISCKDRMSEWYT